MTERVLSRIAFDQERYPMRSIKPTTIRLDDEDIKMVEIIKKRYGQSSLIGALRTALRIAVEGGNVATNVAQQNNSGDLPHHKAKP
jgi:hypothetical protein